MNATQKPHDGEPDDATVVAPRGRDGVAFDDDATVVAPHRALPTQTSVEDDETIVAPREPGERTRRPERAAGATGTTGVGGREVIEERDGTEWARPENARAIPRVYPAHPVPNATAFEPPDAVHQQVGPPPAVAERGPAPVRTELPSLARRSRRARLATLLAYAVTLAVSVGGLWIIARVAFG